MHQATFSVYTVYTVEYDQKLAVLLVRSLSHSHVFRSVWVKIYQFTLIMAGAEANVYSIYSFSIPTHNFIAFQLMNSLCTLTELLCATCDL